MEGGKHPVILFDGLCNLCNWSVQFVIRRDREGLFRFGALQSPEARHLLQALGPAALDVSTVVLVEGTKVTTESDAVLAIARKLGGAWGMLYWLVVVPRPVRDGVYRFISRHRYRYFGRRRECMVPASEQIRKFI
jgi:predicted DCC family thiol-disulfide oxidoreductase YuxK